MYTSVSTYKNDFVFLGGSKEKGRSSSKKIDKDYTFGFNGQHKDNEIKGVGNSLDFGARIYDSRLGKWLSLDPLQSKYPFASPYNFVSNNPIKFIDVDGRDYSTKVNHTERKIVIQASFYAEKNNKEAMGLATNLSDFWTSQNGKWQYSVKVGEETFLYDIVFETNVGKYVQTDERGSFQIQDTKGPYNEVKILKDKEFDKQAKLLGSSNENESIEGFNWANSIVLPNSSKRDKNILKHEGAHAFNVRHKKEESISEPNVDDIGDDLNANDVTDILGGAGIGIRNEMQKDESWPGGTNTKTESVGSAPDNFNTGKVIPKKK